MKTVFMLNHLRSSFFGRVHASSHPTQFNFNNINSQPEFSISKNHFPNKSHILTPPIHGDHIIHFIPPIGPQIDNPKWTPPKWQKTRDRWGPRRWFIFRQDLSANRWHLRWI